MDIEKLIFLLFIFQIYSLLALSSLIILVHANKNENPGTGWFILNSFISPCLITQPIISLTEKIIYFFRKSKK